MSGGADADGQVDFSVSARLEPHAVIVTVAGEVDLLTVPELEAALRTAMERCSGGRVMLDLSGLSFLSSRGLRLLADAHVHSEANGAELVLVAPGPAVRRVLEISGLDQVLAVLPDSYLVPPVCGGDSSI